MKKSILTLLTGACLLSSVAFASEPIKIVAAENFYGDVASQLGKPYVEVTSILNNPNQDPHLFNASPKIATWIEQANIVIENGLGYDTWMNRLYAASNKKAILINVGELFNQTEQVTDVSSMNPHIWYDPKTMPVFAQIFTGQLILMDPQHQATYQKNLDDFLLAAEKYDQKLQNDRKRLLYSQKLDCRQGDSEAAVNTAENSSAKRISVTATEPILGYLVKALGLKMLNQTFQQHVMSETDLTPKEIMQFEKSLNTKQVKLLIYNNNVSDPTTDNLKKLALKNGVPVLGVNEMLPVGMHYYNWMNQTLDGVMSKLHKQIPSPLVGKGAQNANDLPSPLVGEGARRAGEG